METPNVRVCAHTPIESLIGKERNATTSHFVSDYSAARMRAIAREGVYNTEKEYAFSAGIVEGGRARVY